VVFVDFDWFKVVNDCFGYCVGDEFLVYVVDCLWVGVCYGDVVVCIGGDEFVVVGEVDDLIVFFGVYCEGECLSVGYSGVLGWVVFVEVLKLYLIWWLCE